MLNLINIVLEHEKDYNVINKSREIVANDPPTGAWLKTREIFFKKINKNIKGILCDLKNHHELVIHCWTEVSRIKRGLVDK